MGWGRRIGTNQNQVLPALGKLGYLHSFHSSDRNLDAGKTYGPTQLHLCYLVSLCPGRPKLRQGDTEHSFLLTLISLFYRLIKLSKRKCLIFFFKKKTTWGMIETVTTL